MVGPTIRPTFDLLIPREAPAVIEQLRTRLVNGTYPVRTQNLGGHFMVWPLERDVHFWSPWLDLDVGSHPEGTRVFGRFSPRPSIWTGFMCAYFGLVTAGTFAALWGATQILLEQPPLALWIALGCGLVMGLMIWASRIGQRLAHDQMARMKAMVFEVLELSDTASERPALAPQPE